jgi:hypothetical protein
MPAETHADRVDDDLLVKVPLGVGRYPLKVRERVGQQLVLRTVS